MVSGASSIAFVALVVHPSRGTLLVAKRPDAGGVSAWYFAGPGPSTPLRKNQSSGLRLLRSKLQPPCAAPPAQIRGSEAGGRATAYFAGPGPGASRVGLRQSRSEIPKEAPRTAAASVPKDDQGPSVEGALTRGVLGVADRARGVPRPPCPAPVA